MRYPVLTTVAAFAVAVGGALPVTGAPIFYNQLSAESQKCVECHQESTPVLDQQWGESRHHRGNVGCYECHGVNTDATNALDHNGFKIHVIVTPKDCSRCHERPYAEMENSHHAKAGEILGSLDNVLANVVEGNKKFYGKSALAVNGCLQCHGSEVRLKDGEPTVDTWPNDGIGRLNVDGSVAPAARVTCATPSPWPRRASRRRAAVATWGPTIRRRRSTRRVGTASSMPPTRTR